MRQKTKQTSNLRDLLSRKLGQASLVANRIVAQHLEALSSNRYQYAVLTLLKEEGAMSQADLCRRAGIDRSDMVAILNELESQEHVGRKTDPDDRRRNTVTLTTSGITFQTELSLVISAAQEKLLAPFTGSERADLSTLLEKLLAYHGAH